MGSFLCMSTSFNATSCFRYQLSLVDKALALSVEVREFEFPVGQVKEKLPPATSLVSVHHLRPRTWIVGPVSFKTVWVGYHAYLQHGILVCWHMHFKTRLESEPVTADLTTTVVYSSKLLINDVKPDHSLRYISSPLPLFAAQAKSVSKIRHSMIYWNGCTFLQPWKVTCDSIWPTSLCDCQSYLLELDRSLWRRSSRGHSWRVTYLNAI